jgi:aerobic carbon-monoxide dehydrogenase large subunit
LSWRTIAHAANPMLVEGQVVGGMADGLGTLFERMIFSHDGPPMSQQPERILAADLCRCPAHARAAHETPTPLNPLGVKGVGEAGVLPVADAIISAIEDALKDFGIGIDRRQVTPSDPVEKIAAGRQRPGGGAAQDARGISSVESMTR